MKKAYIEKTIDKEQFRDVVIIKKEILFNDLNGFGIFKVKTKQSISVIKGFFITKPLLEESYYVVGFFEFYKNTKQVFVQSIFNTSGLGQKDTLSYLKSLKGLKKKAHLIYDAFGEESLHILKTDPERIAKTVKGVGLKSLKKWQNELILENDHEIILRTLLSMGLTINQSKNLYNLAGSKVVESIQNNPYLLIEQCHMNFNACDRIAQLIGFDYHSPTRIQASILEVLKKSSLKGHCFLPLNILIKDVLLLLSSTADKKTLVNKVELSPFSIESESQKQLIKDEINIQIDNMIFKNILEKKQDNIYLKEYAIAEEGIYNKINEITQNEIFKQWKIVKSFAALSKKEGFILEEKQKEAVFKFTHSLGGFYILAGSAGCGKTFTLKIILKMLESMFDECESRKPIVKLFAPTGKASKVVSKATGLPCQTIHRGLEYRPFGGFCKNEVNPIDADIIIVDEGSMLDLVLTYRLLQAIKPTTKVILLGDPKQLPSVGPGNVLLDLIATHQIKVVTLNIVKRQTLQSGIIKNANRIIRGEMITNEKETNDAFIIPRRTPKAVIDTIILSIEKLIKTRHFKIQDIQVLCPQKTGETGTYYMNYLLQSYFNKCNSEKVVFKKVLFPHLETEIEMFFKEQDKIIHLTNDIEKPWYQLKNNQFVLDSSNMGITNGECGTIYKIEKTNSHIKIIVDYNDHFIIYEDRFDMIDLAYALTIHKSQGSQWPAIIMPILKSNYILLENNLIYTGYTRAESFSAVIGDPEAIQYAIQNFKSQKRYTSLTSYFNV